MKLVEFKNVEGILHCVTGLRIGGTKEATGIGETDNPIIRHPVTRLPYVPGSSLKGKFRSLLEQKYSGQSQETGKPCTCGKGDNCFICRLFGSGDVRTTRETTRLVFRDCPLTPESEKQLSDALPGIFAETKTEIAMDRKAGHTRSGSLRQNERVPEGTEFQFSLTMRIFDVDNAAQHWSRVAEAIEMLEADYLGGSGTRGYGRVKFLTPDGKPLAKWIRENLAK